MKSELLVVAMAATLAMPAFAQAPTPGASSGGATPANAVTAPPTAPLPPTVATPAPGACCRVAAGTVVAIELAEPVGTRKQKRGDHFALRLAEPIVVAGGIVVPTGAAGFGEVVDAAGGGAAGKPAKLILAARYVDYDGVRVLLHGFRLGGGGHDNSQLAGVLGATPYIGLLAIAIPGGDLEYPTGTRAAANVTADVLFSASTPSPTQTPTSSVQGLKP